MITITHGDKVGIGFILLLCGIILGMGSADWLGGSTDRGCAFALGMGVATLIAGGTQGVLLLWDKPPVKTVTKTNILPPRPPPPVGSGPKAASARERMLEMRNRFSDQGMADAAKNVDDAIRRMDEEKS